MDASGRRWGLDAEQRLTALAGLDLVPGVADPVFEPYVRLVQRLLGTPVALVSFVTADRQIFASSVGLGEPWASRGQTPLELSFCQHVVTADAPLVVTDARDDERVRDNGAIEQLGVRAYLGTPLHAPSGEPLGSLCAIDSEPRRWTDDQLAALQDVADAAGIAIALRIDEHDQRVQARDASHELRTPLTALRFELDDLASWPETTEGLRAALGVARQHVDALDQIVDGLLDRTRARLREDHEDVDVAELARTVAARWRPSATTAGHDVLVDAPDPVLVRTGVAPVRQALDVLVERAVGAGGTVTVVVSATAGACRVVVRHDEAPDAGAADPLPEAVAVAHQLAARVGGRVQTDPVLGSVELLLPRT